MTIEFKRQLSEGDFVTVSREFEEVGFIKYFGDAVPHGVIDASSAGNALLGLDDAIRFFVAQQAPDLASVRYEIPVETRPGSWEAVLLAAVGGVAGTFALSYAKKAGEKMAENDFKDIGLKMVLQKSMAAIKNLARLIKHTRKPKNWQIERIEPVSNIDMAVVHNSKGEPIFIPIEHMKWFQQLPPQLLVRLTGGVRKNRTLAIGVIAPTCPAEDVLIDEFDKAYFELPEAEEIEDDTLFPELSTWLDPRLTRLPKLERGESWFYPLTRSVDSAEDGTRQVAVEGVFSYLPVPFIGNYDRKLAKKSGVVVRSFSSSDVWYAVDCSVPPLAQMKSVEMISRMHRDWLRQLDAEIRPGGQARRFSSLKDSPWFDAESFDSASAGADGVNAGTLWRAVHIDVLGPLKEQIKAQQKNLHQAYLANCASGAALPPVRERFRHELTGPSDTDGSTLTDGHFLKALVISAQLAQRGLDEYEIVHFLNQHAAPCAKGNLQSNSVRDEWVTGLAKRVEHYREQARAFVKGGYRWLIHAQKP